jgi:hypothetical protein
MTKNALAAMFPEGTMTLEEADPELYGIIKQEKRCKPCRVSINNKPTTDPP